MWPNCSGVSTNNTTNLKGRNMTSAKLIAWLRTATTGFGTAVLIPAITGYFTGQITEGQAIAGVICGLILMLWPEAPKAQITALVGDAVATVAAVEAAKRSAPAPLVVAIVPKETPHA